MTLVCYSSVFSLKCYFDLINTSIKIRNGSTLKTQMVWKWGKQVCETELHDYICIHLKIFYLIQYWMLLSEMYWIGVKYKTLTFKGKRIDTTIMPVAKFPKIQSKGRKIFNYKIKHSSHRIVLERARIFFFIVLILCYFSHELCDHRTLKLCT